MPESSPAADPPPSRHLGSRLVNRPPSLIRSVAAIRDNVGTNSSRIRREEITFAPADVTRGEPAISATMASTHVTKVYRSGHTLFVDLAMWLGAGSVMSAQLTVPDLGISGNIATTTGGGGEQDLRVSLDLPSGWELGDIHRVYVQAMRVSGADATTVRVLRSWQR